MSDIRSSWEIAQERVRSIGDLTAEEREEQQKKRFHALGRGIAEKYMNTGNAAILDEELRKYEGADREQVGKAALEHLVSTLDIYSSSSPHQFAEGIIRLGASPQAERLMQQVHACFAAYRDLENAQMHRIQDEGKGMLARRGVKGSAVGTFNVHARSEWNDVLYDQSSAYREKLEKLKEKLAALKDG